MKIILSIWLSILSAVGCDSGEAEEGHLPARSTLILKDLKLRGRISRDLEEYIPQLFCALIDEGIPAARIEDICLEVGYQRVLSLWNPIWGVENKTAQNYKTVKKLDFSYTENIDGIFVRTLLQRIENPPCLKNSETPMYSFRTVLGLQLPHLTEITFTSLGLEEFPLILLQQPTLKLLSLAHNKIKNIPSEIENLISLKKLILVFNEINFLPESIGNLSMLEYLDLSNNYLTNLPSTMFQMELDYIDVRENNIPTKPLLLKAIKYQNGQAYWNVRKLKSTKE